MVAVCRRIMARKERTYTPRVRSVRPLGSSLSANAPPSSPHPCPVAMDGLWYIPSPLSQRLHQKSALGQLTADGGILLTIEEVMFSHWYRHVPLPEQSGWLDDQLSSDGSVLSHVIVMDVMRNGGELVVPACHLEERFPSLPNATWAVRWQRHESWKKHKGFSQIRVQRTHDSIDWNELQQWVVAVLEHGHLPELCVMDDEMDVTVYKLSHEHPTGDQIIVQDLDTSARTLLGQSLAHSVATNGGYFIGIDDNWPLPAFGIPHLSGRFLRQEEFSFLSEDVDSNTLYSQLAQQRLLLRPGFKYGCKWRAYETDINTEHAPWLVQPVELAADTWEGVCLSVRLAEGVNKRWLCAIDEKNSWKFLNIQRSQ